MPGASRRANVLYVQFFLSAQNRTFAHYWIFGAASPIMCQALGTQARHRVVSWVDRRVDHRNR